MSQSGIGDHAPSFFSTLTIWLVVIQTHFNGGAKMGSATGNQEEWDDGLDSDAARGEA
jgi:hypothetical protein